ncbi:MAG TPA: ABC transporter ATP-binding protein [Ardenticatenaceae bacterium]|jgi:ABC-2 type transport system ATP-binding protein
MNLVSASAPAIETRGLRKEFGQKVAVSDLSLTVQQGEIFGFLGPNGAGKTTSIKMFLGLVTPTSGEGFMLGAPLGDYRARARVGFLPEHFRFHDWLTATEFLTLHADLYGMPRAVTRARIPELLERVGLAAHARNKLRTFSKGMLQRIGLAQALINDPALLFLDEPTSGLDPGGRLLVRDIIREQRERGTAVFLNSHLLSEVEITCDRVAFVRHGEVLQVGAVEEMVEGEFPVQVRARNLPQSALVGLEQWATIVHANGEQFTLSVGREADLPVINRYLVEQGAEVYAFHPQHLTLEERFLQVIGTEAGL